MLKDNQLNNYLVTRVFCDKERPYLKTNSYKTTKAIKGYNLNYIKITDLVLQSKYINNKELN